MLSRVWKVEPETVSTSGLPKRYRMREMWYTAMSSMAPPPEVEVFTKAGEP